MPPSEGVRTRSGPTRATPVALLAVAGVLLLARVALGVFEHVRPVERASRVEWREPAAGEAEAHATGRPILYWFVRDDESPSRQMSREVFSDPRIAEAIQNHYVPVRAPDLSRDGLPNHPDVARLEKQYAVTVFPTLVAALPDGGRFERQPGYPGMMATTQFISGAAARLLLRPGFQLRIGGRDSVFVPDSGAAGR